MTLSTAILWLVTAQRLLELVLARHNTRKLLAAGAIEVGHGHYPAMMLMHGAWLATLWLLGRDRPVDLALISLFAVMQVLRVWVIATLGERWTTRIIVLPQAPLVTGGPFRFVRHPNYCIVTAEIALLPLAFGMPITAAIFTLLNAAMLSVRIRAENRGLVTLGGRLRA